METNNIRHIKNIKVSNKYLNIPLARNLTGFFPSGNQQRLVIVCDGEICEEYGVLLSENPDFWGCLYLDRYSGKDLKIILEGGSQSLLDLIEQSDEQVKMPEYSESLRPLIHFAPRVGRMNDPNGLLYYNGKYHCFFQLNPYGLGVGNTHWGHAVSTDLFNWTERPYAVLPDENGVCFSGSGVVDYLNTSGLKTTEHPPILLFYTSCGSKSWMSRGKYCTISVCVSTDGGQTFEKYCGNPVIENISFINRDPKVTWLEHINRWVMVLYLDTDRYMLLFSDNLLSWRQGQILELPYTAECPDIFPLPLDGDSDNIKWVIWGSPENYVVGHFEGEEFVSETNCIRMSSALISAHNNSRRRISGGYAAQCYFGVPENRVIQQSWITTRFRDLAFSGCLSTPVELGLVSTDEGPRLTSKPAKEIETMYKDGITFRDKGIEELERIPGNVLGECMHIKAQLGVAHKKTLAIAVRGVLIVYDPASKELLLPNGAFRVGYTNDTFDIEIITDRGSVEIFADKGKFRTVINMVLDPAKTGIDVIRLDPSTPVSFSCYKLN